MDQVSCSRCLWLCRTRYRQKYASVYPSPSVGCCRSSGLKIASCRREHLVFCSSSCSLCPLEKRKLLAKPCICSLNRCIDSKTLRQPLKTSFGFFGDWGGEGGVGKFLLLSTAAHVIALPETAFSEYSVNLCHCTDSWETLLYLNCSTYFWPR